MAGMIPRPFIDDLLDRIDIVDVIDHRVKLKKAGKNYSACCPFHDEKTPSFTVSPDKQFYYCFGCGATGNALGFIIDYERLAFPDAVEVLAKTAGLNVPRELSADPKQREREQKQELARKSLYHLMELADNYYQQQLKTHGQRQRAVGYLKRRGLSGQIAKDFGIGFAPPGWDNLAQTLATSSEKQERLLEAGMLIERDKPSTQAGSSQGGLYDRFRDRIMFPIRDTRGRVIAFGGRVLDDSKPKYLNSPETPIFSKGNELYGLFEARQAYKQLPRLLVVEGYMDVVALAQFGIRYGAATLGTACSEAHLTRAFRFTNEVVFCFDGDEAGRKAARRAMENALPAMEDGRQVKFLYLPEGEDPDTLIRQVGADKFTKLVSGATPLESFIFETLSQDLNTQTMEGRARLCKLAAPMIDLLPRGVYRELMFQQLASRCQLSMDALLTLLGEWSRGSAGESRTPQAAEPSRGRPSAGGNTNTVGYTTGPAEQGQSHWSQDGASKARLSSDYSARQPNQNLAETRLSVDELALSLLLFEPKLAQSFQDLESLSLHNNERVLLLRELMELLHQRPEYTSGQIIGHWQGAYGPESSQYLQQLLAKGVLFQHIRELGSGQGSAVFNAEHEFLDALRHLQGQQRARDCSNLVQQLNAKPIHTWTDAEKRLYCQAIESTAEQA